MENTDKKIIKTSEFEVSPFSTLPPGLDEGKYTGSKAEVENSAELEDFDILDENSSNVQESIYVEDAGEEGVANPVFALATPANITIKSQTVRTAADGKAVVDVVISVPNVKGAADYDVRITKV